MVWSEEARKETLRHYDNMPLQQVLEEMRALTHDLDDRMTHIASLNEVERTPQHWHRRLIALY